MHIDLQSDTGGPCVCRGGPSDPTCNNNTEYSLCQNELRRDYVTSTSAIALISTFMMGALANMPLGLAPGLGGEWFVHMLVIGIDLTW